MEAAHPEVMKIAMTLMFALAGYLAWATTFGAPALAATGR